VEAKRMGHVAVFRKQIWMGRGKKRAEEREREREEAAEVTDENAILVREMAVVLG
jgi:hypothetical protein